MKKGEIFWGRKNSDAKHPIIYLKPKDQNFFIGAMLTHSENKKDNVPMNERHFRRQYFRGGKCKLGFDKNFLVKAKLIKKVEWGPFSRVGELTAEGIKFVEFNIENMNSVFWEAHLKK